MPGQLKSDYLSDVKLKSSYLHSSEITSPSLRVCSSANIKERRQNGVQTMRNPCGLESQQCLHRSPWLC